MKEPPNDDLPPPYEPPTYGFQPGVQPGHSPQQYPNPTAPPPQPYLYQSPPPQYGAGGPPHAGSGQAPPPPAVVVLPVTQGQRVQHYQTPSGQVTVISNSRSGNGVVNPSGLVVGGRGICRSCGVGVVQDVIPWFAILAAIIFFPFGLVCLCCTTNRCSNCGSAY